MALGRKLIPVLFGQGIDTKSDPKSQVIGSLRRAENVVYETLNSYRKRNGYNSLKLKDSNGTSISSPASLTKFKNELDIFADNQYYAYSTTLQRVVNKGRTYTARPTSRPVLINSYNHDSVDSVAVEGINTFVYRNTSLGDVRYSVQDSVSGTLLVSDDIIAIGASNIRVSNINNRIFILYSIAGDIFFRSFDIFQPLTLAPQLQLANDLDSSAPIFDIEGTSTKLVVAYNSTVGGNNLKVISINSDSTVGTGFGVASNPVTALDIFADRNERIVVGFSDTTAIKCVILNFQITGLQLPPTTIETIADVANITGYDYIQNSYKFYYEISAPLTVNHYIKSNTVTLLGVVGAPVVFIRGLGIATKVFNQAGSEYITTSFSTALQATYFVLDTNAVVVSKISPDVGGGHVTSGAVPRVAETSDTTRSIPTLIKGKLISDNNTFFSLLGVQNTVLDFDPINPYATALLGDNLHIAGGILQMYDGETIVEHGFNYYPETLFLSAPTNTPGGLVTAGNYSYQALYRWTDNFGQEHRSVPSIPLDVIISGAFAPTGTWSTATPVTVTTVSTGPARNGNTITLQILAPAANPSNTLLLAITGTAAAVVITYTPNSGANNAGIPVNLTSAQLAIFLQSGVGAIAGTYLSSGKNITTSGGGVALLGDIRASGGGAINLVDGGPGDGSVATLANGANTSSANIIVPTLRLTQKTSVAIELYRTEDNGEIYYLCSSTTVPTFSDPTVDTVTINDGLSDALLISRQVLYTTGGVLENTAPPSADIVAVHTASNRVFLGGLEDANALEYSKIRESGKPVEFNEALRIAIDPIGGAISAITSMDEKLIVFETDAVFYIAGQGPTNTGEQDNFILPERISIEIGCIEPSSVCLTPEGLMFKSRKGIYLLSRSLQLQYIGAPVQQYNDLTITSAKTVAKFNQVRFTTSDGDCLVYNYFVQKWATFTNHSALSAELVGTDYYYLRNDGELFIENPESFSDNGSAISMVLETAWMSLEPLQGFQRVYNMIILGSYKSPHKLLVSAGYNFNEAWTQEKLMDPADFISGTAYGEDSPYGSGSPYGGDGNVYEAKFNFKKQKCTAIKLRIEDKQEFAGEALSLSAFTLEVGIKRGTNKLANKRNFGVS